MTTTNRTVRLASRPTGMVARDNFIVADEPIAAPGPGEVLVRIEAISLDPAMRG